MINDPRYEQLKTEEQNMQQKSLDLTQGLVEKSAGIAEQQNAFLDTYQQEQKDIVNRGIELEQQKLGQVKTDQAKAFQKEATGAYTDYQKFTNQYGAQAEQQAMEGTTGTGFSETSKVRAYGEYQRRYTSAKDTMEKNNVAVDLAMSEARLKGDVQLAQQALELYTMKNQNTLRDFEFSSNLALQQITTNMNIANMFYGRQQDLINQITQQQQAQFQREQFDYSKEQDRMAQSNWEREFKALQAERNRDYALKQQSMNSTQPITDTQSGNVSGTELMPRVNSFFKYYDNSFKTVEDATAWLQKSGYNNEERVQILQELIRRG